MARVKRSDKEKPEVVGEAAEAVVAEFSTGTDSDTVKETAKNVFEWAVGGKSATEIMKTLGFDRKEWEALLRTYPLIRSVFGKGKDWATAYAALSITELAMPTTMVEDEVVTHETIVDEEGNRRQVPKVVKIKKHVDASVRLKAAQYLLEQKRPDIYGDDKKETSDNKAKKDIKALPLEERKKLYKKVIDKGNGA